MNNDANEWRQALNQIPFSDKERFLQAQQVASDLVVSESDPQKFLVSCDYDYNMAAKKLTKYWDARYEIFGESSAFLPLKHGGALGDLEMEYLNLRALRLLPPDNRGRTVIMVDTGRLTEFWNNNLAPRIRASFALLNAATENEQSQTKGIVIICMFGLNRENYDFTKKVVRKMADWLITTFPLKFTDGYAMAIDENPVTQFALRTMIDMFLIEYCFDFMDIMKGVVCSSPEDTAMALISTGDFSRHSLPVSIGGEWVENESDLGQYEQGRFRLQHNIMDSTNLLAIVPTTGSGVLTDYPKLWQSIALLPVELTADLMNTVAKVPYLFKTESHPAIFLSFCNNNSDSAALMLSMYWKLRREYFADCAHNSLLLPSSGALNDAEVRSMAAGYLQVLPKDKNGRSVIFCDPSKLDKSIVNLSERCLFFALQGVMTMLDNLHSMVLIVRGFTLAHVPMFNAIVKRIAEAFPFNVEFFLLCQSTTTNFNNAAFTSLKGCAEFIFCSADADFANVLHAKGFHLRYLPRLIGGFWTGEAKNNTESTGSDNQNAVEAMVPVPPTTEFLKKQHLRLKARRTRARKQSKIDAIKADIEALKTRNATLRNECVDLTTYLNLARREVRLYDTAVQQQRHMMLQSLVHGRLPCTLQIDHKK